MEGVLVTFPHGDYGFSYTKLIFNVRKYRNERATYDRLLVSKSFFFFVSDLIF